MTEFIDYSQFRHPRQDWVDKQVRDLESMGVWGIETRHEPEFQVRGYLGLEPVVVTWAEGDLCYVQYGEPGALRRWWRKRKKARASKQV